MMRWILLGAAGLLALLSLLNGWPAPTLFTWKLAILSGEFGADLAVIAVAVGVWAFWIRESGRRGRWLGGLTLALAIGAAAGLLRPAMSAARLARDLPERARQAFGAGSRATDSDAPLSWRRLFWPQRVPSGPIETLDVPVTGFSGTLPLDFYRPRAIPGPATADPGGECHVLRDKAVGAGGPVVGRGAACVVMIHGGGWDGGDRGQLAGLNRWLAGRGYAVAAVSYRLAPEHRWPVQRDDILASVAFLKANAARLGIDPARLVLMGRSAGGQLATAVGYQAGDPAIRGVVAWYAPHDLRFAWEYAHADDVLNSFQLLRQYLGGAPDEQPGSYAAASGYLHVTPSVPPTFLVHGALDTLVWHQQSVRLEAKLAEAGVRHLFISLPWATHAFDVNLSGPGGQLSVYALEAFLRATVGDGGGKVAE